MIRKWRGNWSQRRSKWFALRKKGVCAGELPSVYDVEKGDGSQLHSLQMKKRAKGTLCSSKKGTLLEGKRGRARTSRRSCRTTFALKRDARLL